MYSDSISPWADDRFPLTLRHLDRSDAIEVTRWKRSTVRKRFQKQAVYWLLEANRVVYVGVSADAGRRIYELRYKEEHDWTRAYILPVRYRSRETWVIRAFQPPRNAYQRDGVLPREAMTWLRERGFL